jgi:cyclic pyranopterin phosphate synthase
VDGTLYLCLGQNDNYAFRPLLRGGASDEQLSAAVHEAIGRKPERHDFREQPGKIVRFMNLTGG